jgi:threonyl-tRNA synthetase
VPQVNLSTRPEKSVGTDAIWSLAEGALQQALQQKGWAFQVRASAPAVPLCRAV